MMSRLLYIQFLVLGISFAAVGADWKQKMADGFRYSFRTVNSVTHADRVDSALNPGNMLGISDYRIESDWRADFYERIDRVDLMAKPRLDLQEDWWDDRPQAAQSDTEPEVYINEWRARMRLVDDLALSYGRENLQWGPSYLLSPSNPFNQQNGRNRPKTELPGSDYARAVWTPSHAWTVSTIVNTDEGRLTPREPFQRTAAVKVDRIMEKTYISVIASKRESADPRAGLFGTWSATDGLLLYAEGSGAEHDAEALIGQSYTFIAGPTLSTEYFYNESGTSHGPVEHTMPPFRLLDSREAFLRRNYALIQFLDGDFIDRYDVTLRWTLNLDDHSNNLLLLLEYEAGDNAQIFALGTYNSGDPDTEFASILRYTLGVGVEFFF